MHCAGGDGARPALRTVFCDGGAGCRRRHECRHRGGKAGVAAGHRRRRDDRDPCLGRGYWALDAEGAALAATAESGEIVLNGHKSYVVDGHTADLIVVLARAPQGLSLFTVDGNAAGLTRRALKSMDPTRKFARLEFDRVAARPLGTVGGAATPFARSMVEAAVCLANEMVGGADRLREDALAYAMMRMQFGKPIASFQSMKHKHADMLLEVELAKSAAYYAAASLVMGMMTRWPTRISPK